MGEICDLIDKVTGCGVGTIEKAEIDKASYYRISISLDTPLDNVKLSIAGEYLTVGKIRGYGTCKIRFNYSHGTLIDLREVSEFEGHFTDVYFTTDGVGYECVLYVATSPNSKIRTGKTFRIQGGVGNLVDTSKDYVQRFYDSNLIMNEWHIRNTHITYDLYIGLVPPPPATLPDIADFRDYAFQIVQLYTFKLIKVNLCKLGYATPVNGHEVGIRCMGTVQEYPE